MTFFLKKLYIANNDVDEIESNNSHIDLNSDKNQDILNKAKGNGNNFLPIEKANKRLKKKQELERFIHFYLKC
jgi:hypothetical protein